jgi:integrase
MPVKAVREIHIEDWMDRLNAKGLARQTRLHCLNLMRIIFRRAKKKRLAKENPCLDVRLEVEKRTHDPWTFLSPEEQDAIIAATPKPLDAIVEFAIGTGLRSGEMAALRLADLHLDGDDPYVTVRYGGPPAKPTKWGRIRQVPLFGHGMAGIRRWLEALPTYAKDNPKGLAFPAQQGGFRNHDHLLRWYFWKGSPEKGKPGDRNYHAATTGILERAGITRRFRWHDLRHTCASSLVSGWWGRHWTLKEVCALLGHRSITTTERYAHLADTALKKAARETILLPTGSSPPLLVSAGNCTGTDVVPKPKVAGSRPVSRSSEIVGDFVAGIFGNEPRGRFRGRFVKSSRRTRGHDQGLDHRFRLGGHGLARSALGDRVRDVGVAVGRGFDGCVTEHRRHLRDGPGAVPPAQPLMREVAHVYRRSCQRRSREIPDRVTTPTVASWKLRSPCWPF